jgi:hypothetical protein
VVDGASSATMVLLPKQVHLQNDVGATPYQRVSEHGERRDILAARDKERDERNVRRRKRRYGGFRIVGRWSICPASRPLSQCSRDEYPMDQ